MKQNEKELLLKDISARLPYGVKASTKVGGNIKISFMGEDTIIGEDGDSYDISFITPYLFPLSSMTDEQKKEFVKYSAYERKNEDCGRHTELYYYDMVGHENNLYPNYDSIDWLNKNHFDYRGLIPMGLAKDATGLNIY